MSGANLAIFGILTREKNPEFFVIKIEGSGGGVVYCKFWGQMLFGK
jgi:hypothetical protein